MSDKKLSVEEKIEILQDKIPYFCYKTLLDNKFTKKNLIDLYEEIYRDCEEGDNFSIVKKPEGDKQNSDESSLKVWVNQTCNGGYTGDDFSGDIFIKINDNLYLRWIYWC